MRFHGVVPDEIVHKFAVKVIRFNQVVEIQADSLFLYRSIEALQVAIGLGMPGVVEIVSQAILLAVIIEVFGELTAIVCLHSPDGKRSHIKELAEEIIPV